ncbi:hypothetical protein BDZ91DRAFT_778536 [Kalaharituber pfeilii]|nr:hypothetical protein BDZ91DRAFT_778536 [Kalaharituber pfeilii]
MSSQRSQLTVWKKEEFERLVRWMEENLDALSGKQITWYKQVKEEEFADDDHITVKKINDKVVNAKRAWKEARAMLDSPDRDIRPEDGVRSINELVERKCPLFERLDAIWGSRHAPNPTVTMESSSRYTSRSTRSQHFPQASTPSPAPEQASTPSPAPERSPSPQSTRSPTPEPSTATPHPSTVVKRNRTSTGTTLQQIKRMLDEKQKQREIRAAKRLKAEMEWQREKHAAELELQRELLRKQLAMQETIEKMYADAQAKQMESFARMMEMMTQRIRSITGSDFPAAAANLTASTTSNSAAPAADSPDRSHTFQKSTHRVLETDFQQ